TLADMVARMIAKGLLERERAAHDARANAVRLTALGLEALTLARPKMAAADGKLLKRVGGGARREAFVDLLLRMTREEPAPKATKAKSEKKKTKAAKPKREKAKEAA